MKIDFVPVGNYTQGRNDPITGKPYRIEAVVMHRMDGTLYACDNWFNNPKSQASAHYGIGGDTKREIHQYVKLEDTAWHAGGNANGTWNFEGLDDRFPNYYTIGIEQEALPGQPIHPDTIDEASWLVAQLYVDGWLPDLNRNRIIGHGEINQVSRKNCPGNDLDAFLNLVQEKVKILKPLPITEDPNMIKELQDKISSLNDTVLNLQSKYDDVVKLNQNQAERLANQDNEIIRLNNENKSLKDQVEQAKLTKLSYFLSLFNGIIKRLFDKSNK